MTHTLVSKHERDLFDKALKQELLRPKRALDFYKELEGSNTFFYPELFKMGLGAPIGAFIISLFIAHYLVRNPDLAPFEKVVTFLVMALFGYGAPIWVYELQLRLTRIPLLEHHFPREDFSDAWSVSLKNMAIMLFWHLINDAGTLIMLLFYNALFAAPFLLLMSAITAIPVLDLPYDLKLPVVIPTHVLAAAHLFGDWSFIPFFPPKGYVKGTLAGLLMNLDEVVEFYGTLLISAVLAAGAFGLVTSRILESFVPTAISAILLAFTISRFEADVFEKHLILLGRIRCLLEMRRYARVHFFLREARASSFNRIRPIGGLTGALSVMHSAAMGEEPWDAEFISNCLDDAKELDEIPEEYRGIWQGGVVNAEMLRIGFERELKRRRARQA